MSRNSEIPHEPDWHQLALVEAARIPDFKGKETEIAEQVAHILRNMKTEVTGPASEVREFTYALNFGSKILKITLSVWHPPDSLGSSAKASLSSDSQKPKAKHETTILFIALKLLLQTEANRINQMINYKFRPTVQSLVDWAEKYNGSKLFEWEDRKSDRDFIFKFNPKR